MSPEPAICPPLEDYHLSEYELLMKENRAPSLRAWVRESDKACRANERMLKESHQ